MRCPKCGSWITGMPLYFPIVQKFSSEPITDPTIHISMPMRKVRNCRFCGYQHVELT